MRALGVCLTLCSLLGCEGIVEEIPCEDLDLEVATYTYQPLVIADNSCGDGVNSIARQGLNQRMIIVAARAASFDIVYDGLSAEHTECTRIEDSCGFTCAPLSKDASLDVLGFGTADAIWSVQTEGKFMGSAAAMEGHHSVIVDCDDHVEGEECAVAVEAFEAEVPCTIDIDWSADLSTN